MNIQVFKYMRNKYIFYGLLIAFSIAYFIQYQYSISCMDDDLYIFIVPEGNSDFITSLCEPDTVRKPIESFRDVIVSNIHAYNNTNGRFIVHSVVQACCAFMSMHEFAYLNTIVFFLFLVFLIKVSLPKPYRLSHILIAVSLFWFLLYKGRTYWGTRALVINYMWCGMATLFLYYLFDNIKNRADMENHKLIKTLILFFVSLIIGSLSESFSFGLAAVFVVYYIINHKKLTIPVSVLIAGYGIGALFTAFAPGNLLRASGRVSGLSINFSFIYQFLTSPIAILLILTIVYCFWVNRDKLFSHFKKDALLWLYLVFSCTFMLFIAYNGKHQLTCVQLLSLILILRLWFPSSEINSWKVKAIAYVLLGLMIVSYFPILQIRKQLYDAYQKGIELAVMQHDKDGMVVDEDYERIVYDIRQNYFIREYHVFVYSFKKDMVSARLSKGESLDYIKLLLPVNPSEIVKSCNPQNELLPHSDIYRLKYNFIAYRSMDKLDIYKTKLLFFESYAGGQLRKIESSIRAYERLKLGDYYYYIYPGSQKYGKVVGIERVF